MSTVYESGVLVLSWRARWDDDAVEQRVTMPAESMPLVGDFVELGHGPDEHRGLYRVTHRRLAVDEMGDARWYAHAINEGVQS